jgi:hypothetical protein
MAFKQQYTNPDLTTSYSTLVNKIHYYFQSGDLLYEVVFWKLTVLLPVLFYCIVDYMKTILKFYLSREK